MENQVVETGPIENKTGEETSSYTILSCFGKDIPANYNNLIYSKWLRSLRFGNDYFKLIDSDSYFKVYDKYIESILHRPDTIVRFAVVTNEKDTVLGFSVTEKDTLHYVYVHKYNRKQGIGTSLVPKIVNNITHLTKTGMSIWTSKLPHAKFNPFI